MGVQETIVLYPAADPFDLGPKHVDIHLFPALATGGAGTAHALRATLPVLGDNGIGHAVFTHPLHGSSLVAVALGMIEVESVQRSTLTLFCLGGYARMHSDPALSTVELESNAPIVLVGKAVFDDDLDPIDLFVNELEAWISVQRARARGRAAVFDRLLLRVPAYTLYIQGLILAARRLGSVLVDERSERYWRSYNVIHKALEAAKHHPGYPAQMPNFEQMLTIS